MAHNLFESLAMLGVPTHLFDLSFLFELVGHQMKGRTPIRSMNCNQPFAAAVMVCFFASELDHLILILLN